MKKTRLIILLQALTFLGCASTKNPQTVYKIPPPKVSTSAIMRDYLSTVTRHDGIEFEEAVLIAQSEMIFRGKAKNYHLDKPMVEFVNSQTWGLRFYPVNESYRDAVKNVSILISVEKQKGKVRWHSRGISFLLTEENVPGSMRINKVYEVTD